MGEALRASKFKGDLDAAVQLAREVNTPSPTPSYALPLAMPYP